MKFNSLMQITLGFVISFSANASDSLCSAQEQTVFSCSLGKKIVSVCASTTISPTSGYIQYRFGKINAPELTFPVSTNGVDRSVIQARNLMFSGGGGSYLRFINGHINYIVYTAIGKGWGTKDGVSVIKDTKAISNLKCRDVPVSKMGVDFFTQAGLSSDKDEYSLP